MDIQPIKYARRGFDMTGAFSFSDLDRFIAAKVSADS